MMKTDLHKKAGHTGAPRLRLPKKAPVEPEKDTANPYRMPPRRWFLTFMCMNIPIAGWVYLLCLAFGKKRTSCGILPRLTWSISWYSWQRL